MEGRGPGYRGERDLVYAPETEASEVSAGAITKVVDTIAGGGSPAGGLDLKGPGGDSQIEMAPGQAGNGGVPRLKLNLVGLGHSDASVAHTGDSRSHRATVSITNALARDPIAADHRIFVASKDGLKDQVGLAREEASDSISCATWELLEEASHRLFGGEDVVAHVCGAELTKMTVAATNVVRKHLASAADASNSCAGQASGEELGAEEHTRGESPRRSAHTSAAAQRLGTSSGALKVLIEVLVAGEAENSPSSVSDVHVTSGLNPQRLRVRLVREGGPPSLPLLTQRRQDWL